MNIRCFGWLVEISFDRSFDLCTVIHLVVAAAAVSSHRCLSSGEWRDTTKNASSSTPTARERSVCTHTPGLSLAHARARTHAPRKYHGAARRLPRTAGARMHARTQPRLGGACRRTRMCMRAWRVCTSLAMYVPYINTWRSRACMYTQVYVVSHEAIAMLGFVTMGSALLRGIRSRMREERIRRYFFNSQFVNSDTSHQEAFQNYFISKRWNTWAFSPRHPCTRVARSHLLANSGMRKWRCDVRKSQTRDACKNISRWHVIIDILVSPIKFSTTRDT